MLNLLLQIDVVLNVLKRCIIWNLIKHLPNLFFCYTHVYILLNECRLTVPAYRTLRPNGAMSRKARALARSVYVVLCEDGTPFEFSTFLISLSFVLLALLPYAALRLVSRVSISI
ncbi:MAG TPA: hypothetical protein VMW53_05050 [archaeon]|nr:hypothetical protein [archaeon]